MRKPMLKGEAHKKGQKQDGIKPADRPARSRKNDPQYTNFQGESID
ncbi:hypothetical protein [Clostridium ganghwense]|uniref:Uncharacterized protein n=1 Tax=Clostridium ganghwense TaxID=312089 RepID=A0ABT4CRR2_9CLOT|nr:hypothetical protein [Clostridium ganghwense]MCY6370771.1 hypothetical protein [Clostridium ganghwense]